jgi:hypothetical protein
MMQPHRVTNATAGTQNSQQEGASKKDASVSGANNAKQKQEPVDVWRLCESEPYTQWSTREVGFILGGSPWIRTSSIFVMRESGKTNYPFTKEWTGTDISAAYQVRMITARPVREAYLRSVSLNPTILGLDELANLNPEKTDARLKDFLLSNPHSIFAKEDEENIILAVRLIYYHRFEQSDGIGVINKRDSGYDELTNANIPKLLANTFLETDSGKKSKLSEYVLPGRDRLGAKLVFKRALPDGTPFITEADKELRLVLPLKYHKVKVAFDLRKMMYKGKLEL